MWPLMKWLVGSRRWVNDLYNRINITWLDRILVWNMKPASEVAEEFLLACECGEATWSDGYRDGLKNQFIGALTGFAEEASLNTKSIMNMMIRNARAEGFKEGLSMHPQCCEEKTLEIVKQARAEGIEEGRREKQAFYDASVKDHYREGFQDGLEEAAKVVEEHAGPAHGRLCADPAHDDRYCGTCEAMRDEADVLEQKLRALKAKP